MHEIFQHRTEEVRIALLGHTKTVRGLPDHRMIVLFLTRDKQHTVRLALCVTYTYLQLSRKFILSTFNFRRCAQRRKYSSTKFNRQKFPNLQ